MILGEGERRRVEHADNPALVVQPVVTPAHRPPDHHTDLAVGDPHRDAAGEAEPDHIEAGGAGINLSTWRRDSEEGVKNCRCSGRSPIGLLLPIPVLPWSTRRRDDAVPSRHLRSGGA